MITIAAPAAEAEVQEVWLSATGVLSGSFALSLPSTHASAQASAPLAWDANSADLAAAIRSLPGTGEVPLSFCRTYFFSN